MIEILLEVLDSDWSRGWVRLRGLLLIGAILFVPTQTAQAIGWVAQQLAAEKTAEIISVLERVAPVPSTRAGIVQPAPKPRAGSRSGVLPSHKSGSRG
jgi:hypothetical protein